MINKLLVQSIFILLLLFCAFPSSAGDIRYYDPNGNMVGEAGYEKIVENRSGKIIKIIKNGYGDSSAKLEDPVLLRKRRVEQWKRMRAKSQKL